LGGVDKCVIRGRATNPSRQLKTKRDDGVKKQAVIYETGNGKDTITREQRDEEKAFTKKKRGRF